MTKMIHIAEFFTTVTQKSYFIGLPWWLSVKESACNACDLDSIPGPGRSPGEGNGDPLQYSCLENPLDRGAWWAIVHGVAELDTTERLVHTYILLIGASLMAQMVKNLPAK